MSVERPAAPEWLPVLVHEGILIEPIIHHGFSRPLWGPPPVARTLYGARNPADGERHWRSTYDEITSLIDRAFQ